VWFNIAITGDRLSSASVEIDKNSSLTLPYPGGKVCVTGGHVTSRNQGLSLNDKGGREERAWNKIGSVTHQQI